MQNLNTNVQELSYISLFSKNVPDQLEPSRRLCEAFQGWSSMRYISTKTVNSCPIMQQDSCTEFNCFLGFIHSLTRTKVNSHLQITIASL